MFLSLPLDLPLYLFVLWSHHILCRRDVFEGVAASCVKHLAYINCFVDLCHFNVFILLWWHGNKYIYEIKSSLLRVAHLNTWKGGKWNVTWCWWREGGLSEKRKNKDVSCCSYVQVGRYRMVTTRICSPCSAVAGVGSGCEKKTTF